MLRRSAYLLLLFPALAWCAGFIVVPLLHPSPVGEALSHLYGRVCHQIPERSVFWGLAPWAVCIRCSSIYIAFTLTLAAVPVIRGLEGWRPLSPGAFAAWLVPVFADAVLDFLGVHSAGSLSRFVTGTLAGVGLSLTITPLFLEALTKRSAPRVATSSGDPHA